MAVSPAPGESAPYASTVTIQVSEGLPRVDRPRRARHGRRRGDRASSRPWVSEVEVDTFIAGSTVR